MDGKQKVDRKALRRQRREYFGRRNLGFTPLEDWALRDNCRMTIEGFLGAVESGAIDWDCGSGYYATSDKVSGIRVSFDPEALRRVMDNKLFQYVVWYNK